MSSLLKNITSAEVVASTKSEVNDWLDQEKDEPQSAPMDVLESGDGRLSVSKESHQQSEPVSLSASRVQSLVERQGMPWNPAYAERVIPWYASDERVDRHGDIVEQTWDFRVFDKNPIMLYGHDWDLPPIGTVLSHSVIDRKPSSKDAESDGYTGPALQLMPLFATKEEWDYADTIFRLAKARFLRTGSVGFFPGKIINVKDEKDREKLGLGDRGVVYQNNELVEWTIASVPANSGAHQILNAAKKKGLVNPSDLNVIRELKRREIEKSGGDDSRRWAEFNGMILTVWKSMFPDNSVERSIPDLDMPLLLKEIGCQSEPANEACGCEEVQDTPIIIEEPIEEESPAPATPINLAEEFKNYHDESTRLSADLMREVQDLRVIMSDIRGLLESSVSDLGIPDGSVVDCNSGMASALEAALKITDEHLVRSGCLGN